MEEINIALHKNLEMGKRRLIVAVLKAADLDNDHFRCSGSMKRYLARHTDRMDLICSANDFRARLLYALATKKIGRPFLTSDVSNVVNVDKDDNVLNGEISDCHIS